MREFRRNFYFEMKMNENSFVIISRSGARPADGNLTAASLIDAIITHQINQTATEPPVIRDGHRPPFVSIFSLNKPNF